MTDNVTNFLASGIEIKGTIRFPVSYTHLRAHET